MSELRPKVEQSVEFCTKAPEIIANIIDNDYYTTGIDD